MREKIDIHHFNERYPRLLEHIKIRKDILSENKKIILNFLRDCELGKTIKKGQKKKISPARLVRLGYTLISLDKWLKKPFDKVTEKEMEDFILNLEKDIIKTKKGKPFTSETKVSLKKIIRKFYKWLLGNGLTYPDIVSWIDTSGQIPEIPAIGRSKIDKICDKTGNTMQKALLYFLFDSGARPEECLNVTVGDLQEKDNFYKVRIVYSKTKPRTISITLATPYIRNWLESYEVKNPEYQKNKKAPSKIKIKPEPDMPLFPLTYNNLSKILKRLGKKIGLEMTPRVLRHSSATYYSNIIRTRTQLCYRYGWSLSSRMPDRYIDRNGIIEEETSETVKVDEITKFKKESEKIKEEMAILKEQYGEILPIMNELIKIKKGKKSVIQALVGKAKEEKNVRDIVEVMSSQNNVF